MKLGITKEYHYQKLALKSRKVCHALVYLATSLHSNNTNDVKELNGLYTKRCCKDSCCAKFIIALKENVFIFNATFSRGWCISSSTLRTFRCVKIYIFLRTCRSMVLLWSNDTEIKSIKSKPAVFNLFYTIATFWKVWVQITSTKHWWAKIKKGLHVRRSTIFPLKIGEEQKKDLKAVRSLRPEALALGNFFIILFFNFVICNSGCAG